MKKILFLIIFIFCFNFYTTCSACGITTGGACKIDDLTPPSQPEIEKRIIKPEQKIKNNNELEKTEKTKSLKTDFKTLPFQKNKN